MEICAEIFWSESIALGLEYQVLGIASDPATERSTVDGMMSLRASEQRLRCQWCSGLLIVLAVLVRFVAVQEND